MVVLQNVMFQTAQKNITALLPIEVNCGSNKKKLGQWDSGSTLSILSVLGVALKLRRRNSRQGSN